MSEATFRLPEAVMQKLDVGRLARELDGLDKFFVETKIRPASQTKAPALSRLMEEICEINKFNLLEEQDRVKLAKILETIYRKAPLIHISFAADPSSVFLTKLISWIRQEIHAYALVTVGLQPGLGAGCVVRTKNKYFDFSLRQHLQDQRAILVEKLSGGSNQ